MQIDASYKLNCKYPVDWPARPQFCLKSSVVHHVTKHILSDIGTFRIPVSHVALRVGSESSCPIQSQPLAAASVSQLSHDCILRVRWVMQKCMCVYARMGAYVRARVHATWDPNESVTCYCNEIIIHAVTRYVGRCACERQHTGAVQCLCLTTVQMLYFL